MISEIFDLFVNESSEEVKPLNFQTEYTDGNNLKTDQLDCVLLFLLHALKALTKWCRLAGGKNEKQLFISA